MVQYWRAAGFTYLKYANICARMLRYSLKPEHKAKVIQRFYSYNHILHFNLIYRNGAQITFNPWKDGRGTKAGNVAYSVYFH
jgi:hypothetical protein